MSSLPYIADIKDFWEVEFEYAKKIVLRNDYRKKYRIMLKCKDGVLYKLKDRGYYE